MEFNIYLKCYSNYDKAIIASGDGDFRYLVEYLEKQDKLLLNKALVFLILGLEKKVWL